MFINNSIPFCGYPDKNKNKRNKSQKALNNIYYKCFTSVTCIYINVRQEIITQINLQSGSAIKVRFFPLKHSWQYKLFSRKKEFIYCSFYDLYISLNSVQFWCRRATLYKVMMWKWYGRPWSSFPFSLFYLYLVILKFCAYYAITSKLLYKYATNKTEEETSILI